MVFALIYKYVLLLKSQHETALSNQVIEMERGEVGREEGKEGGREGRTNGRTEGGKEGEREKGREEGGWRREGGREGGREVGREGGRIDPYEIEPTANEIKKVHDATPFRRSNRQKPPPRP